MLGVEISGNRRCHSHHRVECSLYKQSWRVGENVPAKHKSHRRSMPFDFFFFFFGWISFLCRCLKEYPFSSSSLVFSNKIHFLMNEALNAIHYKINSLNVTYCVSVTIRGMHKWGTIPTPHTRLLGENGHLVSNRGIRSSFETYFLQVRTTLHFSRYVFCFV